MRTVRVALLLSAICGLVLMNGCAGARTAGTTVSAQPAGAPLKPVSLAEAHISAVVLLDSTAAYGDPAPSSLTVSIVGVDGRVIKRTAPGVSKMGYEELALSPDGRALLYPTRGGWSSRDPFSTLRELDLDTGRDVPVIASAPPVAWGWDAAGSIVAVTATRERSVMPSALTRVVVWRGPAGHLESATVEAGASPVDITGFITADARTAYFGGVTSQGPADSPSLLHVWRYDFASHALTAAVTSRSHGGFLGSRPGTSYDELSAPAFSQGGTPSGDPVTGGLRRNHYDIVGRAYGGGFGIGTILRSVDVLRPPAMRALRSAVITPTPAFDPRHYPPVFDSAFSRYIEGIAPPTTPGGKDTGPARLAEVEIASGKVTFIDAPPSAFTDPLGYLGPSSAFVYRSVEASRVAVSLKEPGKPSRVILRLGPVASPAGPLDRPVLLGIQYAR